MIDLFAGNCSVSGVFMNTSRGFILFIFLCTQSAFCADINAWIKPSSGAWEESTGNWSLGVLPNSSQSVNITNAGWKAVAIGANTAQNFPGSMQIQDLHIASPV